MCRFLMILSITSCIGRDFQTSRKSAGETGQNCSTASFEFDFQSTTDSVISETTDPRVVHGTMLDRQWIHQMIATHNPVATISTFRFRA
jgi:hypothetical protein